MSIALELQGHPFPRPLAHDLMKQLLETLGGRLEQVAITEVKEGTYYATLNIRAADGSLKELDARPSDSVALALRTHCPIYIADEVFDQSAIESPFAEEEKFHDFVDKEVRLAEFRKRTQ